jgi:hypothetical protein
MLRWSRRFLPLAVALLLSSCGSDNSFSPTVENVSGSYSATSFTAASTAGTLDLLALGASVHVTLAANGTTTGRLLVPGGDGAGGDLDQDLAGTWTLSGDTVTFNPTGASVIQGAQFTAARDQLTGEGTFGDQTLRLVLTKD